MSKFELLKHETFSELVEHTYTLKDETGVLVYKEWVDQSGSVMDFTLRNKDGEDIGDPELFDQVMEFIDTLSIED
jgi:hypothetical protein